MITKVDAIHALSRRNPDFSGVVSQQNITKGPFAPEVMEASNRSLFSLESPDLRSLTEGVSFFLNRVSTVVTENPGLSLFVGSVVLGRALFGSRKQEQGSVSHGEGISQSESLQKNSMKNEEQEPEELPGGNCGGIETVYPNSVKRIGEGYEVVEEKNPGYELGLMVNGKPERCETPVVNMTIYEDGEKQEEKTKTDTFQTENPIRSPDRTKKVGDENPETEHPKSEESSKKENTGVSQIGLTSPLYRAGSLSGDNFDSPILFKRQESRIAHKIRMLRGEEKLED